MLRATLGEIIGTFVLVFIGIGSVAVAVLYDALNLYQIAGIWTIAVVLGIYSSKNLSDAHLNPAVSLGFVITKELKISEFIFYLFGQMIGALLAGFTIYFIFSSDITFYEISNNIIRGTEASKQSAMMFGEFYPNPGNKNLAELSTGISMLLEGLGTFVLMFVILNLVHSEKINAKLVPVLIGVTVGILIVFIAPYTQAGFNPFRDLGPRIVSYLMGWKGIAFNLPQMGAISVYVFAPLLGAVFASLIFKLYHPKKIKLEKSTCNTIYKKETNQVVNIVA
jgi:glycerol uptake facilitator protein